MGIKPEMALNEGKINTMCCNDFEHCNSMNNCGFVRATKWQNNFAETAQDGNNGTMNSKVSNPC